MALAIGRLTGADDQDLVQVLKAKGATGVDAAQQATSALIPLTGTGMAVSQASGTLATSDGAPSGRQRKR